MVIKDEEEEEHLFVDQGELKSRDNDSVLKKW